jgi:hypothetical protein
MLRRTSADQTEYFPAGAILGKKKNEETKLQNPEPQPLKGFSMQCYTEETGGLQHYQMPAPNLVGRCRPTGEQISRQTGLDAEGVTPELLILKFYCS